MSRRFFHLGLPLLAALLLAFLLRVFVADIFTVSHDCGEATLLRGDRVWVSRWSHGLRLPLSRLWGCHRLGESLPKRGDWMVFNSPEVEACALPDTSRLCIGRVLAGPGDTIWLGNRGRVSPVRNYAEGCIWPVVVPGRNSYIRLKPWNRKLYERTLNRFETPLDTSAYTEICPFHRDYFWIATGHGQPMNDSRRFGLVPMEHMVGRASFVVYSAEGLRHIRWKRFFTPVDRKP